MKGRCVGRAVLAAAAVMLMPCAAFAADPAEELKEILEKQEKLEEDSLLSETLGLEELKETMKENGWAISLDGQPDYDTTDATALVMPENIHNSLAIQVDLKGKKWQVSESYSGGESSLDLLLYGDEEQLALGISQLYEGTLGLTAGNLKEQYQDSGLSEFMELFGIEADDIPDMDLKFYPDEGENPLGTIWDNLREKTEQIQESAQVEKAESDGEDVYTLRLKTADILDLYEIALDGSVNLLEDLEPIVTVEGDLDEYRESVEEMTDDLESVLEEEMTLNFHVQDGFVASLDFEMYLDPEKLDEVYGEDHIKTYGSVETAETEETEDETEEETEEAQEDPAYLCYTVTLLDPADPDAGADIMLEELDEQRSKLMDMQLSVRGTRTETAEEKTVDLTVNGMDGETYSGRIYQYAFDSASGEMEVSFETTDSEAGETVTIMAEGAFTEIEKGKSFTFSASRLGMTDVAASQTNTLAFMTDLTVSADPGALSAPADTQQLFEMDSSEILNLVNEISENVETLMGEESETETETDTELE